MIYTSYFGKARKFPMEQFLKTAICYKVPRGIGIWNSVVPPAEIVFGYKRGEVSEDDFEGIYYDMLLSRKTQIKDSLDNMISQGRDIVLMCYEKPDQFCHRHVLAKFLNEQFDLNVTEYKFEEA